MLPSGSRSAQECAAPGNAECEEVAPAALGDELPEPRLHLNKSSKGVQLGESKKENSRVHARAEQRRDRYDLGYGEGDEEE
jgi:hypothetical protein